MDAFCLKSSAATLKKPLCFINLSIESENFWNEIKDIESCPII